MIESEVTVSEGNEQQFLTSDEVAELLEMARRTVQKYAVELHGIRGANSREFRFTVEGICRGARELGLNIPERLAQMCREG